MKPFMSAFAVLVASLAAAAGCRPLAARSSAAVLGPDGSSAVVRRAPAEAALEVARLLSERGYAIVDQRQDGATIALRLKGVRRIFVQRKSSYEIGSAYHVTIAPHGDAQAEVTLIGRPIYEGAELCTSDLRLAAPCERRRGDYEHEGELDGAAEAEVVHGVFSELQLRGEIDDAAVSTQRIGLARDLCRTRRQEEIDRALAHRAVRARAVAYAHATRDFPPCE
jgi:hypothetical protein